MKKVVWMSNDWAESYVRRSTTINLTSKKMCLNKYLLAHQGIKNQID